MANNTTEPRLVVIGSGYPISTACILDRLRGIYENIEIWSMEDFHRRHQSPQSHMHELTQALLQKATQQQNMGKTREYWYNFIDMRDREVERGLHRPPKKAHCTTRRRGRKCKK